MRGVGGLEHLTAVVFGAILRKTERRFVEVKGVQMGAMELGGMSGHEAGRILLAEMYRERTGKPLPPILLTERGKPYFSDGTLHFSISHTPRRVFCVLSDRPVGVDAEELDRDVDLRLADKVLSEKEKARYAQAEDKRLALLRLWVLKEAAAKCSGEGLRGYPNKTDFSPDDPRVTETAGCLVAVIEE